MTIKPIVFFDDEIFTNGNHAPLVWVDPLALPDQCPVCHGPIVMAPAEKIEQYCPQCQINWDIDDREYINKQIILMCEGN